MKNTIKAVVAMLCITGLELYALSEGINGTGLSAVVAALAALGGYAIAKVGKSS